MSKISDRLNQIKEKVTAACVRSGRDESEIRLIVVTKTAPLEGIKEVIKLGYRDFGENRAQHLKQVATEVAEFFAEKGETENINMNWHMIGHLQRNKVKQVLKIASLIHSVDTLRLAEEVNTVAGKLHIAPEVLIQVNCSEEPQKYGAPVGAATHLAEQIATMPNLRLSGLMTMAPLTLNKDVVRACFVRAREIFEEIRGEKVAGDQFRILSMGMSQDYEIAIEEGATMLRIGSAIFAG